jgi:hypothetical protein
VISISTKIIMIMIFPIIEQPYTRHDINTLKDRDDETSKDVMAFG